MLTPVMSAGSRSGVNWMRLTLQSTLLRERLRQHRLADARNVFHEQVALGQQHGGRDLDHFALALDDGLHRRHDGAAVEKELCDRKRFGGAGGVGGLAVDFCSASLR